jgi:hypothetical protein
LTFSSIIKSDSSSDKTFCNSGKVAKSNFHFFAFKNIQHVHGKMEPDDEDHYLLL